MQQFVVRSVVALAMLGSAAQAATLSGEIGDYVLLAIEEMHTKRLVLSHGDVAVNDPVRGRIISKGPFDAPSSIVGANEVRFNNRDPHCGGLVANETHGTDVGCTDPMPFDAPFADVAAACGFPAPLPACDAAKPVRVAAGETLTLAPGVYGALELDGGPRGSGTVVLAGDYVFCSIDTGRDAAIEFGGPSVVSVAGDVKIGRSSAVMGGAIDPETVRFFIGGERVTIIQRATVTGVFCAPNAKLMANHGVELNGRYIARDIRLKMSAVQASSGPECTTDEDCDGGVCVDGTCVPASCTDGVRNGAETDVDCGGGTCPACGDGGGCQTGSDCESGVCVDGVCQPATCTDGVRNGAETGVDCGGGTCPKCPDGGGCQTDDDCESGTCVDGVCVPVAPTCTDGIQNGAETGVDCGGGTCPKCPDGGGCQTDDDCESGACMDGVCVPATCMDGRRNGQETDVDCGGPDCPNCPDGGECETDDDCESGMCVDGVCVPVEPTCTDGVQNGAETDVDCGGGTCPKCPDGGGCQTDDDCESGMCVDGVCVPVEPTCTDGVQNGAETDVDCGGGTCPKCPDGGGCQTDDDCESGRCIDGVCVPIGPECGNGIVEEGEICDGDEPCDPSSPMGAMIICADDCLSIEDFQCPIGGDEVCGDCVDNDEDDMIDLDDPDCGCDDAAPMSLTKVRIRMNERPRIVKRLKVRSIWAGSLPEGFDPRVHGVELQLNDSSGTIYCANFEAGRWKQRDRTRLVYKAPIKKPRRSKPSNGLKLARFKVTDDGQVIFKARGPRARVEGDVEGDVLIRVKAGDQCTASSASLRSKGRELVFP